MTNFIKVNHPVNLWGLEELTRLRKYHSFKKSLFYWLSHNLSWLYHKLFFIYWEYRGDRFLYPRRTHRIYFWEKPRL